MFIKQLSVFLENREGILQEVTEAIMKTGINILSLSLADTTEYGMLRMIVQEPEKARSTLKAEGFSAMLTDVVAVKLTHEIGTLNKILKVLHSEGIGVEYMYALSTGKNANMIMKLSDAVQGIKVLTEHSVEIIVAEDAYKSNE